MNKKCFLIPIFFISVFLGCEKKEDVPSTIIKPDTADGQIAKAVIGRGYDICGCFANSEYIKNAVFDFNSLTSDDKIIKDGNIASTTVKDIEGATISEYQAKFSYARSGSAGIEGLFSAEVGASIGYERSRMTGYSYATVSSFTYKYGIYIDGRKSPSGLVNYVSNDFLSNAETMTAEQFIESYGTHVIVGGKWGASFDFSMSAKRISTSNMYSFGAYTQAEANIQGFNIGGSQDISASFGNFYETNSKKTECNAKGGSTEYISAFRVAETPEARDAAYSSWVKTIDENPAFCDYYEGGLVPIYEFIHDETLKTKIKSYVDAYALENEIESLEPVEEYITSEFDLTDFCKADPNADGDIHTDGKGDIYVEVIFNIEEAFDNTQNLNLRINMKVHEKKGDYSKLEGESTATIVNNDQLNSIDLSNRTFSFNFQGPIAFSGKYFSPLLFQPDLQFPSWLSDVQICVDGAGDDEKNIGITGKVKIPVTVYKF